MSYLYLGIPQWFDENGDPLALGKIYTYITLTTTPKTTYTSATGGASHPNPVILDSAGMADIWLKDDAQYRIIVKNAAGVQIGNTKDAISGVGPSTTGITTFLSNVDTNGYNLTGSGSVNITGTVTATSKVTVNGTASGPSSIELFEDTDNGSNKITVIAPSSIASDKILTLQDVTGTIYQTGGTAVAVADGGTGAATAATARTNLGLGGLSTSAQITTLPSDAAGPSQVKFFEATGQGSNFIALKGASPLAADINITLPDTLPTVTSLLTISSAGAMATSAASGFPRVVRLTSVGNGLPPYPLFGHPGGVITDSSSFSLAVNTLYFIPVMLLNPTLTTTKFQIFVGTAQGGKTLALNLYASNSSNNAPTGSPLGTTATVSLAATGGVNSSAFSYAMTGPAVYWIGMVTDAGTAAIYGQGTTVSGQLGGVNTIFGNGTYHYTQSFTYGTTFPTVSASAAITEGPGAAIIGGP